MGSKKAGKVRKSIPFEFVLEALAEAAPYTKAMFGCVAVYVEDKIVFILRDREDQIENNGVWLATTPVHHKALLRDFPAMRSLKDFGLGPTGWQVLPSNSADFEESVMRACELVLENDPRIGKVPKARVSARSSLRKVKFRSKK